MATRKPIVGYLWTPKAPGDPNLDAQRQAVQAFAQANRYRVVEEFADEDVASSSRDRLRAALNRAQREACPVVVARLECLSRDAGVVEEIAAREVPVIVAGQVPVVIRAYKEWSQRGRERHGRKIKRALTAKKAEGIKLGNPVNLREAGAAGRETQIARAEAFAAKVLPIVKEIRAGGVTSFSTIAAELNRRGVKTARGLRWAAMSVRRILQREEKLSPT